MHFLHQVLNWLGDGDNWFGRDGLVHLLRQHLQVSAASLVVAIVIALPVGLTLGHFHRGGAVATEPVVTVAQPVDNLAKEVHHRSL